ncbi:autotransporter outer membrane beta-barrel domain-containing protein [Bartonella taylorii]|uniref:autotransporter family protein n=1 Tax=Bartonella taylorii TaxID=33046 RepID=UPI001ABAC2F3|nr:autotransporter outer membrane beta-barrel domain-containing protein [Bartonella taylorii]
MINIFKKRACLCALTTSVLFFLQGVYVCAGNGEAIEVSSVQGSGAGSPASTESLPASPTSPKSLSGSSDLSSSQISLRRSFKCEDSSYKLNHPPVYCDDGKNHTIKRSSIKVDVYGVNAVHARGKNTIIDVLDVSIRGHDLRSYTEIYNSDFSNGFGSAVFSEENGRINLSRTNIRDFITGLEARNGGQISMTNGEIRRSDIGVLAASEGGSSLYTAAEESGALIGFSAISLKNATIDVFQYGLHSIGNSTIMMKSGSIYFTEEGTGAIAEDGGHVNLESVSLRIKGEVEDEVEDELSKDNSTELFSVVYPKEGILVSKGGFIFFNDGMIQKVENADDFSNASDVIVLAVSDGVNNVPGAAIGFRSADQSDSGADQSKVSDNGDAAQVYAAGAKNFSEVTSVINKVVSESQVSETYKAFKVSAGIKDSEIEVDGENSVGIYFRKKEEIVPKQSGGDERYAVLLKKTVLASLDGVGVYNDGLNGMVVLEGGAVLSGSLLLKAVSSSKLDVFAHDSFIIGGARIDKDAEANLFLTHGSEWHLVKSRYQDGGNSNENCIDSCISSLKLLNSTIGFVPLEENEYQTLRIGKGDGVVYSAVGEARMSFNAGLNSKGLDDVQISDRVLIHGDISGKTTVHVNDEIVKDFVNRRKRSESEEQNQDQLENGGNAPQSFSIIQVYGKAEASSFQLNSAYVTIPGLPYQYILRAYGPMIAPKMQYFDKKLIKSEQVWDFRLESKINIGENETIEDNSALEKALAKYGVPLEFLLNYIPGSGSDDLLADFVNRGSEAVNSNSASTVSCSSGARERVLLASSGASGAVSSSLPAEPSVISTVLKGPAPIVSAGVGRSDEQNDSAVCDVRQDGTEKSQTPYSCSDGKLHTIKGLTLKASDSNQHLVRANRENTVVHVEGATIIGAGFSDSRNNADLTGLQPVSAVLADGGAEVVLDKKSTVKSSLIGLEAQTGGKVRMTDGEINAHYIGVLVGNASSINLSNTKINVVGDLAVAGLASNGGEITMDSGAIALTEGVAVRSESRGRIQLNKVDITAKKGTSDSTEGFGRAAFLLSRNGSVNFINGNVATDAHGLWIRDTDNDDTDDVVEVASSRRRRSADVSPSTVPEGFAVIESSTVKMEGDRSYGIYFDRVGQKFLPLWGKKHTNFPLEPVLLKKTNFEVPKSVAIYGNNSAGYVSIEEKATLSGDLLLRSENNSRLLVGVDNSIIKGGARIDNSSHAHFNLAKGSVWFLTGSRHEHQQVSSSACSGSDSCISSIKLRDSAIKFVFSASGEYQYQTLFIGKGVDEVYWVDDAHLYLNTYLNKGGALQDQKTDRVLIHGDVSGETMVHVHAVSGSPGGGTGVEGNNKGISIIQVSGKAEKDSFQLDGGYVALENSPYKYVLRAYGPGSELGKASAAQRLVEGGGEFWDFRLENGYIDPKPALNLGLRPEFRPGRQHRPEIGVKAVVPQVPTYLLLPNSIFHAGLMDISNQNKQLEALRTISSGMVGIRENPALYLRGYGGRYRYASDLSAREYGYGGDLNYNGVEAGVLLQTIESVDSTISFGVMGSYGKLSLQPQNVDQSQKSSFDKWTGTAYGSMQHGSGFYVDGLLSYGFLKGDVLTSARGKTAALRGSPLSVSLTGGQTFATGYKGFVFDPQVQVVYQHLQFSKARDVDNFDIEMGKLEQWVARVGGRLVKIPREFEGMNSLAFYGKLYFSHGFGERQSVRFKDTFQLGGFGSSLEAGLGFNVRLSGNFALHADMIYQHKLTKAGFSGASFSGGVRYQF